MKKISTFLFILTFIAKVNGQQRPQYTQYMISNYMLNPAISGIEDYTDIKISNRQQWLGLKDGPVTSYLSVHTPINKQASIVRGRTETGTRVVNNNRFAVPYAHHGIGVNAISDKAGLFRRNSYNLTYAYHLPVSKTVTVSMGASAGVLRNSFNVSGATLTNSEDPLIRGDYTNKNYLDVGLGTWIYSNKFFVGLSGAQLLKGDSDSQNPLQKHLFATGGYRFYLAHDFFLVPSVMVKFASPSPTSVDVNVKANYANKLWAGASYRYNDGYAILGGVNIGYKLSASYSFDYSTSNMKTNSYGSHELILGLKLFKKGKVFNPRWLQ